MGSPHTIDVCKNCGEPVVQWNNTGSWEHLGSARMDQAESRAFRTGSKSHNQSNATLCNSPRLVVEQNSVAGRTNANYRTATKKS
jgi:hypothetical protein